MTAEDVAPQPTSTERLADFAAGVTFADLPAAVVAHAKLCLLDTLGCALFGSTLPWSRILQDTLAGTDPGGPTLVWGTSQRLSAPHAALANGTAVHAFELDDLHPRSIVHPGSVVTPAALAAGPATGAELLTAVVVGYEVAARVGMSVGAAHLLAGWHPTGTHGTLGAAAAAGSVLGLSSRERREALGVAGSQSSGLMAAQYESMVKRLHAGRAAQSGLYAALLAARGFTGIADLFGTEYGAYGPTFSTRFSPAPLTAGLGSVWEILNVGFKCYSTNGSCHPTIDALLALRRTEGVRAQDVRSVRLDVSSATKEHVGWRYVPNSVTTAQMNLPYIVAVVLSDGDAFIEQFTAQRIKDPGLIELSEWVQVHADPAIDALGDGARHATRLEITLTDGRVLRRKRSHGRGSARDPLDPADVRAKYGRLARTVLSGGQAEQLSSVIDRLESLSDLRPLVDCLTTPR
jgi:aconitate decarboxylase